jgi:hypothetical protein
MTSLKQFEKITRLGVKCDGHKILIRTLKHELLPTLGTTHSYYTIQLPNGDRTDIPKHDDVWLIPPGKGAIAMSSTSRNSYAYTNGGSLYREAVDAAKEIASALGFPC